jgi:hypothetical protein
MQIGQFARIAQNYAVPVSDSVRKDFLLFLSRLRTFSLDALGRLTVCVPPVTGNCVVAVGNGMTSACFADVGRKVTRCACAMLCSRRDDRKFSLPTRHRLCVQAIGKPLECPRRSRCRRFDPANYKMSDRSARASWNSSLAIPRMRRPLQALWLFLSLGRIDCVGVLHRCVVPRCRPFDVMRWRVIEKLRQVMCAYLRECLKAGCELD